MKKYWITLLVGIGLAACSQKGARETLGPGEEKSQNVNRAVLLPNAPGAIALENFLEKDSPKLNLSTGETVIPIAKLKRTDMSGVIENQNEELAEIGTFSFERTYDEYLRRYETDDPKPSTTSERLDTHYKVYSVILPNDSGFTYFALRAENALAEIAKQTEEVKVEFGMGSVCTKVYIPEKFVPAQTPTEPPVPGGIALNLPAYTIAAQTFNCDINENCNRVSPSPGMPFLAEGALPNSMKLSEINGGERTFERLPTKTGIFYNKSWVTSIKVIPTETAKENFTEITFKNVL